MIVNFYKNEKKVYSVYANSLKEVKERPLAYYGKYTEDMYITDVEYLHPVFDKVELREAIREELVALGVDVDLQEGEKIVDKKLIKLQKPSKWHKWDGTEWTVNLDEVKLQKREELKALRDEKVHSNIEVHGEVFQVREQDIENFMDVERALNRGYKKPSDKRFWILADNSLKEFTYEQLSQVLDEKAKRKDLIFQKFGEISIKLAQCKTVEDIESIRWE